MPGRVLSHTALLHPDYWGFDLHDIDNPPGELDAAVVEHADQYGVAAVGHHILVQTTQNSARVQVTVEIWDQCAPPGVEYEIDHGIFRVSLPSGLLLMWQRTFGGADTVEFPTAGDYEVHAWSNGRAAAGEAIEHITRGDDEEPTLERIREVDGVERYLFQFHLVRASASE